MINTSIRTHNLVYNLYTAMAEAFLFDFGGRAGTGCSIQCTNLDMRYTGMSTCYSHASLNMVMIGAVVTLHIYSPAHE